MNTINSQITFSRKLYEIAKAQYYSGKISKKEYLETLELILNRLNKTELKFEQIQIIESIFILPNYQIDLKETINLALSMN